MSKVKRVYHRDWVPKVRRLYLMNVNTHRWPSHTEAAIDFVKDWELWQLPSPLCVRTIRYALRGLPSFKKSKQVKRTMIYKAVGRLEVDKAREGA